MWNDYEIISYEQSRDREKVMELLSEAPFVLAQFLAREKQQCDMVWVAYQEEKLVGVLSHAGRYKNGKFTMYVAPSFRNLGVGTSLYQKADTYYQENEWTERIECTFEASEETRKFLEGQGFVKYCWLYDMVHSTEPLPEGTHMIRTYEEQDFREYNEIQAAAFWIMKEKVGIRPNYWNCGGNPEYLKENAKDCFVILDGETKVGFGRIHGAEAALLAIRPDYQHCGYGTELLSHMVNELIKRGEKPYLDVVVGNPAYDLYKKLGFHTTKTKMIYYKLYRPDHRANNPMNLLDTNTIIEEFRKYGKLRNESERGEL